MNACIARLLVVMIRLRSSALSRLDLELPVPLIPNTYKYPPKTAIRNNWSTSDTTLRYQHPNSLPYHFSRLTPKSPHSHPVIETMLCHACRESCCVFPSTRVLYLTCDNARSEGIKRPLSFSFLSRVVLILRLT